MKTTKKCSRCHEDKHRSEFYKKTEAADGLGSDCKLCNTSARHALRAKRKSFIGPLEYVKLKRCPCCRETKTGIDFYSDRSNKDSLTTRCKQCHQQLKKKRYESDHIYKTTDLLKARIAAKTKACPTTAEAIELIGCSFEEYCKHIQSQFTDGMTWHNHTRKGWHCDHIVPIAEFDMSDLEQRKLAFHFTNVQPLWHDDHREKHRPV